jgi:hypothetical protein
MAHKRTVDRLREQDQPNGQGGRPRYRHREDEYPEDQRGDAWEPPPASEPEPKSAECIFGEPVPWPTPLAVTAYHGLVGEVVHAIEPHSEADPVALLVQFLLGFGAALGRTAHFRAESDTHYLNEFAALVGKTAKGRKGTSWGYCRRELEIADPPFVKARILGGLSSGEGLIWACRDAIWKRHPIKQKGRIVAFQEVEEDPGVADKRLLAFEPEFASVLRRIEGQGNTLSALLRQAWETGDLRTLTKNSPAIATGAHVALIAHITCEELRRYLSATEQANGFGNRFCFFCVKRSKQLPEGGSLDAATVETLGRRLSEALTFGRTVEEVRRDDEARAAWAQVYGPLSEGKPGLAGGLLARAEAHAMRFASIYAVLDLSRLIRAEHLQAALALWDYSEQSVRYIFGDSLGDPVADDLLRLLRASGKTGVTRSEMCDYFGRHQSAERVNQALGLMLESQLARFERYQTGGRPSQRWFASAG